MKVNEPGKQPSEGQSSMRIKLSFRPIPRQPLRGLGLLANVSSCTQLGEERRDDW